MVMTSVMDERIKWLEVRISSSLRPRNEDLKNMLANEENQLAFQEFVTNEDVRRLFIYIHGNKHITASQQPPANLRSKSIFFLKITSGTKLTKENMDDEIHYIDCTNIPLEHLDLLAREVFLPLVCTNPALSESAGVNADRLMDLLHRLMSTVEITQGFVEGRIVLSLPSIEVLAEAASSANRRSSVLHVLETTVISWIKQIKTVLKHEPLLDLYQIFGPEPGPLDEIQIWERQLERLHSINEQLDSPVAKDILSNLEQANSQYAHSFGNVRKDINKAVDETKKVLRFLSTMSGWFESLHQAIMPRHMVRNFKPLMTVLVLVWTHCKYYHEEDKLQNILQLISTEVVHRAMAMVGEDILREPLESYTKLKEALRVCAAFRGTYLDFKDQADNINVKNLAENAESQTRPQGSLFTVKLYGNHSFHPRFNQSRGDSNTSHSSVADEDVWTDSPWPARNAPCFDLLNSFMERCNDVLELVETTRHFRLLAGAAEVGGAGSQSLDALVKEVHAQYSDAMREFFSVVDNVLSVDGSQSFEKAFFKFRTVVKMLERRLAGILRQAFQQCPTIGAQLRLLEVFEGISGRELVQCHLEDKDSLLVQSFTEEIKNVRNMFSQSKANPPSHYNMPPIVSQMMWVYALKERLTVPMVKMRNVSPHSLEGENGWTLREAFQDAIKEFEQFETQLISEWQRSITYELTTRLKQPLLIAEDYDEEIDLRPQVVHVNLDPMLMLLLREVQYLKRPPFNIKLPEAAKELIRNTDCYEMRVTSTRLETIVSKYNTVMKTITDYEKPLFERKLDKVDQLFDQGLHHYTWKMKESADFIESAMSLVCLDVHQNLDIVQTNCHEIAEITISWSKGTLDVFTARMPGKSYSMEELLDMQVNLTEDHENLVVPSGNKIHSLVLNSFEAVQISQASPAWRDYIQYIDAIILDGLKQSSLTSLKSKLNTLVQANMNMIVEHVPILSIRLELIENRVAFRPPLDQMSSIVSVQELVQRWLDDFVARGKLVRMIGSKDSYEDYIRVDDEVQQILAHITKLVQDNSEECKTLYSLFRNYTFLWLQDVNQTFDDFLHGKTPTSHHQGKAAQQTWDPDRPQSDQQSHISLLDQLDDGYEDLRFIERSFLTPQHNFESDNGYVPSLDEFDEEIDIYRNARDEISTMPDHQDVGWLRVDLQPIKQVLTTYASKWMWTFTKYLSDQVTATLENLDHFLKRIEPEIESITGEERDTASFMKMMRLFNEVSAQQAEMDGKFSIMNKTVQLLKKYGQQLPEKTQNLFHAAPGRWNNLKTKVSLAKQRLGPRIQEESARITTDLEAFGVRVMELNGALEQSAIYNRDCSIDNAYTASDVFAKRLTVLENEAQDLIELQELLETSVVNFSILPECRHDLNNLKQVWETVRVIEDQQSNWQKQRWQKMNTQYLREETNKQLEIVKALSEDVFTWDVYMGLLESITTVQMCLPLIDDLSNPAMRTRHWKQLVRVTGGALTIDNDTLKRMTLGELLGLGLQKHVDDVRAIVQRAVKDLTIEQSLKTYEEVWLSKIFELRQHVRIRTDPQLEVAQDNQTEVMQNDPPSQQHISLVSRTQGRATSRISNQSSHSRNKRGSVASLPQSLLNLGEDSGQICLLHNTDPIFEELESHQVALQAMQSNSAAGSFLDEVIKWQKRLQTIEAVLTVWLDVQEKWIEMEEVYLSTEIRTSLSNEANIFSQINKDVRLVMRATEKNPNVLQCCSRKNIHSILEHAQHNMALCHQSLLRYLERRRQIFPRFYFLSMEDVLHIICNGYDLNQVNVFISKLFEHVDSLLFEEIDDNDRCRCQIIGVVSALGERLEFRQPVLCEGQIESWLTQFLQMLKNSLQFQLATAMGVEKAPPKLISLAGVGNRRIKLLSRRISKGMNDKKNGKDKSSSRSSSRQTLGRDRHRHTDAGHGTAGSIDHQAGQDSQAEALDLEHTAPRSWTIDHVTEIVHLATQIQMTERVQEALTVVDSGHTDALQESLNKIIGSIQVTTLMLRGLKYERDVRAKQDDVNDQHDSDAQSPTEGQESVLESSSFPVAPVNRGRRPSIKASALDNLIDPQKVHADLAAACAEEASQAEDSQSQEHHSDSPGVPKADESVGGEKGSMEVCELKFMLFPSQIQKMSGLLVLLAHQRDLLERFIQLQHTTKDMLHSFDWRAQLQYVFNKDSHTVQVSCIDTEFEYGFEYLGSNVREPITPQTERVFVSVTQAVRAHMGSLSLGSMESGKFEIVNELAQSLGHSFYSFNCNKPMNHLMLQDIFRGLAATGSWVCFNTLDHLSPAILSVFAQLVATVMGALQEDKTSVRMQSEDVPLNLDGACFALLDSSMSVTSRDPEKQLLYLSPLVNLPDCVLSQFRTVTVLQPEMALIVEVLLLSHGFVNASEIGRKIMQLADMTKTFLATNSQITDNVKMGGQSNCGVHGWSLQNMKQIISEAGDYVPLGDVECYDMTPIHSESPEKLLQREKEDLVLTETKIQMENIAIVVALRNCFMARMHNRDAVIFTNLMCDLWPDVSIPMAFGPDMADGFPPTPAGERIHARTPKSIESDKSLKDSLTLNLTAQASLSQQMNCAHVGANALRDALNLMHIAIVSATNELGLLPGTAFQSRVMQLLQLSMAHQTIFVVGPAGCGKSECIKTFAVAERERGKMISIQSIFTKAIESEQLMGYLHPETRQWKDGLLAYLLRKFCIQTDVVPDLLLNKPLMKILQMDGDVDVNQMELLQTIFQNQGTIVLGNNERLILPDNTRFIWEMENISQINPSLLASVGLLMMTTQDVGWKLMLTQWLEQRSDTDKELLQSLCDIYLPNVIDYLAQCTRPPMFGSGPRTAMPQYKRVIPHSEENMISTFCTLFETMLAAYNDLSDLEYERYFNLAAIWSFGGSLACEHRESFSNWWREQFESYIDYPEGASVFDYAVDSETHEFVLWVDILPTYTGTPHKGIPAEAFVHTVHNEQIAYLLGLLSDVGKPVMLIGENGCGKTSIVQERIRNVCSGEVAEVLALTIQANRFTNSQLLYERLNERLEWKHGKTYVPKGNKRLMCLIDDVNLGQVDRHGFQTSVEMVRQHIDDGGFYNPLTYSWRYVKNVTYVSTVNPSTTAAVPKLSARLLRHFAIFGVPYPSANELHSIFSTLLHTHFVTPEMSAPSSSSTSAGHYLGIHHEKVQHVVREEEEAVKEVLDLIVLVSLELQDRLRSMFLPTAHRCHYIFTIRDLTMIFKNLCLSLAIGCNKENVLLLWEHECQWVYGSRMVTDVDYRRFRQAFVNAVKKEFTDDEQIQLLIQPNKPMFTNLAEQDSGIVTAGRLNNQASDGNNETENAMDMYKPIFKMELVSSLMDRGVDEYNKVHPRIKIALYKSVLEQVCRLARTIASPHEVGHTTLVSEGCAGRCSIIAQLAANLCGFSVLRIQPSQLTGHTGCEIDQFKTQLVSGYNRAGVKGDRVMLLVQEDDLQDEDYLIYLLEFIISGSISHLFSYEEQTTIINSIRTEVTQAGLTYTRDVAWDFFLRTVRNNFRICFVVGSGNKFQRRCREYPSFTKSVSFIWFPHWSKFQLVDHAFYHLKDVSWMTDIQRENIAHMLASMHIVLRQQDGRETTSGQYGHITNASYEKFVERFICLAEHRHTDVEDIQVVVNKTLKELSTENEMAWKLKKQLEHEMVVLEERKAGTIQILSQIGQDTAITEQQIRVVKAQLSKISTLKKLLPEYQVAHERAVFKAIAIVADTKKVVQNVDVDSLSELRAMSKPSIDIEDLLAAIIMILKSPSADLTWQKGAKRQMANLERFIEELMSFDDYQLPESTLALVEPYLKKASFDPDMMEKKTENAACGSLCKWVRGVVRYHRMMLSKVKPLHKKVEETTQAVDDAEHKMATLENKRKSLEIRLSSLAKSFEEATIDKTDQDEKTRKMTKMLETAGQLRKLLKGERLRCQQIFDSHERRLVAIPGGCSVGAAFVTYLAPYHHNFRRLMLTVHWPNCLRERGVPLVIDSIDGLRGRVIDWDIDGLKTASGASGLYDFDYTALVQMESYESPASKMKLSHLHSDDNENEEDETEDNTANKDGEGDEKQGDASEDDKAEENADEDTIGDRSGSDMEDEKPLPDEPVASTIQDAPLERIQEEDGDEDETISMARSDATVPIITTAQYGQYVRSLIKLLIGEKTLTSWVSKDFGLHQMENAAILLSSWQRPPLLIDPDSAGISWLSRLSKTVNTQNLVVLNMENRNDSQLILTLEKCILRGKPVLLKNCIERLDNSISPLIHHRNTTHEDDKDEEPRMIHYCSRRVLCHPDFRLYMATSLAKPSFSSEITSTTTMINYGQSHDTLTEDLLARAFAVIRPELYHEHRIALHNLQAERDTLYRLSVIVKEHARKQDSVKMLRSTRELNIIGQIRDTKLEMANRLKDTQLALQELENLREEFFPLARRGAVLYAILRSLSCVRREYQFTLEYFLELFHQAIGGQLPTDFLDQNMDKAECETDSDDKMPNLQVHGSSNAANKENTAGEIEYKDDFEDDSVKGNDKQQHSGSGAESVDTSLAQKRLSVTNSDILPVINLPETKQLPSDGVQYDNLSANHIKQYTDKLTSLVFKSVRNCLYENDCLLLTVLLCLNIQAEAGSSFSEEEMSLLLQGNPGLGMQLSLEDFDCELEPPTWLPEEKWDDMMAVSVLPGPLDSLCVHIAEENKAWQKWYKSAHPEMEPLPVQTPSNTFMEQDQQPGTNEAEQPAASPDLGPLSDFHQLLIIRMLRPDRLPFAMANYVNKHLQLNLLPADITTAAEVMGIDGTEQTDMDVILQDARRHLGVMVLLPLSAGNTTMQPQNYLTAAGFRTLLVPQIQELAQSKGVTLEHVQVGEGCDAHVIDSVDVAEKHDSWIIIENMHLASDALWEALKQKLVMIKNQRNSGHPNTPGKFSLWITTEPYDVIPLYILQNMHQVAWQRLIAKQSSPSSHDTSKSESSALVTMHSLRTSLKDAIICALKQIPDDIWEQVRNESQDTKAAVYGLGIIQGALLSRQLFGPGGLTIWYPFNSVQITQAVNVILSPMLKTAPENVAKVEDICRVVSESIYGHICLSESDQDYVTALVWHVLENVMNNTSGMLKLGSATLPIPPANVEPSAYAHWLGEKLSTDDSTLEALSLHPNVEKEINETDAIQFMQHLDSMFEAQSIDGGSDLVTSKFAVATVNIARLRSALDIATEQLPPLLEMGDVPDLPINQHEYSFPYHRPSLISLDTVSISEMADSTTYVLQQECLWLNQILCHIRQQIHQIMHNILSGVEALHTLFLPTVYSLQEEQVPVSWLHPQQQPGTHSLLSWLKDLKRRYDQLQYWVRHGMVPTYKGSGEEVDRHMSGYGHVNQVWLGGLVNPQALLTALMQDKAHRLKCPIDQLTFKCHVLDTGDLDNMPAVANGGLMLTDMQLHGAEWDFEHDCLCEASDSVCIIPALYVIPVPASEVEAQRLNNPEYETYHCPVFMNKSRQVQVTSFDLRSALSPSHWTLASVVFILDTGLPEDGSRKSRSYLMLQKLSPGIAAADDFSDDQDDDDNEGNDMDEGENENSESKMSMPQSDRSQISYKPISPKAPPLPLDMSLVREKPMSIEVESKKSKEVPDDALRARLETDRQSVTSSEKAASVSSRNNSYTANHLTQQDVTAKPSQISAKESALLQFRQRQGSGSAGRRSLTGSRDSLSRPIPGDENVIEQKRRQTKESVHVSESGVNGSVNGLERTSEFEHNNGELNAGLDRETHDISAAEQIHTSRESVHSLNEQIPNADNAGYNSQRHSQSSNLDNDDEAEISTYKTRVRQPSQTSMKSDISRHSDVKNQTAAMIATELRQSDKSLANGASNDVNGDITNAQDFNESNATQTQEQETSQDEMHFSDHNSLNGTDTHKLASIPNKQASKHSDGDLSQNELNPIIGQSEAESVEGTINGVVEQKRIDPPQDEELFADIAPYNP